MSEGRLPRLIEPGKLAQHGLKLEGIIRANDLPRLAEAVLGLTRVKCSLTFSLDEQFRRLVEGRLDTNVELVCQRCLEAVSRSISADVNAALVRDEEQAKALPSRLDPWLVDGAEVSLYEFVEEELLLNIPLVAWHDEQCINPASLSVGDPVEENVESGRNPFQILGKLKKRASDQSDGA